MCVIMIADKKRLTSKMMRQAQARNPHGLGMAWIEGGKVCWAKGLTIGKALKLRKVLPLPYVFHARWATQGQEVDTLCHPFPTIMYDRGQLEGRSHQVLFHNGTFSEAFKAAKRIQQRTGRKMPDGPMSDTKAMAWIVSVSGPSILDSPHDQKFVTVSATNGIQRYGIGWTKWEEDYMVSNTRWAKPRLDDLLSDGNNGYWTVPSPSGGSLLVKASTMDEALKKAERPRLKKRKKKKSRWHGAETFVPPRPVAPPRTVTTKESELLDWMSNWQKSQREDYGEGDE
jgi:hypothetical protein